MKCSKCEANLTKEDVFCPECGTKFEKEKFEHEKKKEQEVYKNDKKFIKKEIIIFAIVILVIIFALAYFGILSPNKFLPKEGVVCNSPYIKVGTSCCLDQNNNKMCDDDETTKLSVQSTEESNMLFPCGDKGGSCVASNTEGTTANCGIDSVVLKGTDCEKAKRSDGKPAKYCCIPIMESLPNKCIILPGIACTGHKVESTQTTLVLTNALGKDITVTNIAVGACSKAFAHDLNNGDKAGFVLTGCSNGDVKARFTSDITINYEEKDTLLNKTTYGSIATKVE